MQKGVPPLLPITINLILVAMIMWGDGLVQAIGAAIFTFFLGIIVAFESLYKVYSGRQMHPNSLLDAMWVVLVRREKYEEF